MTFKMWACWMYSSTAALAAASSSQNTGRQLTSMTTVVWPPCEAEGWQARYGKQDMASKVWQARYGRQGMASKPCSNHAGMALNTTDQPALYIFKMRGTH